MKRVLAGIMLAVLTLSFVAPSLDAGPAAPGGCPLAPGAKGPALSNAMPDGACDHAGAGPCVGARGCVTASPIIAIVPVLLLIPNGVMTVAARPDPHCADLVRAGPPTPPPDLI